MGGPSEDFPRRGHRNFTQGAGDFQSLLSNPGAKNSTFLAPLNPLSKRQVVEELEFLSKGPCSSPWELQTPLLPDPMSLAGRYCED